MLSRYKQQSRKERNRSGKFSNQTGLFLSLLQDLLLRVPSSERIREWSDYYTNGSHLAGQGRQQAEWTQALWKEFGIPQMTMTTHETTLEFPRSHRVALIDIGSTNDTTLLHEATFVEDIKAKADFGEPQFLPAIFTGAGVGNMTAQYVYANFGLQQDYEDLLRANVDLEGKIALVKSTFASSFLMQRNLSAHRSSQVNAAANHGISGVIVYPDPQMDGKFTEANGYLPYPDGPARAPTLIERGSISSPNTRAAIPAIPISYADAIPLLQALNNHGPLATELNERWHGGGLTHKGVYYSVGPSPTNIVLNLNNDPSITQGLLYNVIGTIPGSVFPDEVVILGNHRDSLGPGANDGNGGSSALNEVVRSFGVALAKGWKPLRTVIFASWDGGELELAGSQAWIDENFAWLNTSVVAYLNVVVAGAGTEFRAQGSPLLTRVMRDATSKIQSPSQPASSILDVWGGEISPGAGGDSQSFQGSILASSVDFAFDTGLDEAMFPYHSQFDLVDWVDRFGDPDRELHLATTKIWSIMTSLLAYSPVIPVTLNDYALFLQQSLDTIERQVPLKTMDTGKLHKAIRDLHQATLTFDSYAHSLAGKIAQQPKSTDLLQLAQDMNKQYLIFERIFAHPNPKTLADRHMVLPLSSFYTKATGIPVLSQSMTAGNWPAAETCQDILVARIYDMIKLLNQAVGRLKHHETNVQLGL
ncbi:hypothetical protein BDV23DRAFT_172155 [Aspergillus alliaceus]|uniref:Peptidase M28 n=1 Tax=Petromyces alliaceus TaxID=209559 RepID=A0A5N7C9S2_PETAA|nr:hypothetical protein BDV23DRAFT_172155 [Aspergillus alliaceus]